MTFSHLSKNIGQLIKCMFLNIEEKLEEGREFIYEAQNYIGILIKSNHVGTYIFWTQKGARSL